MGEITCVYQFLYYRSNSIPEVSCFSDNYNDIRRQSGDQQSNALPQVMGHLIDGFNCFHVSVVRKPQYVVKGRRQFRRFYSSLACTAARKTFGVVTHRRRVRSVYFPAASVAASALQTIFNNSHVAELAGGAG